MSPEEYLAVGTTLKWLLTAAWLLPLLGFAVEIFGGYWSERTSKAPAYLAVACIGIGFLLSVAALGTWLNASHVDLFSAFRPADTAHADPHHPAEGRDDHGPAHHGGDDGHHANNPLSHAFSGTYYTLGNFGRLSVTLDYFIDGLTIAMFVMVTLIATCIHIFAIGYMSDELTEHYEDHFVHLPGGKHFHRPGRFYRFFAYMSLFCFSMLGLVLAGNIFQVFIFWELVGVCSYLLIGFYVERKSASTAANKAFIMNRVGDFGFLVGLMVIWTWFGVFQFADTDPHTIGSQGLFQMVRDAEGRLDVDGEGMDRVVYLQAGAGQRMVDSVPGTDGHQERSIPYWLLVVAGLGIFAGCIGKSAQFPLQTWLPDAMEGPTPVSALVHSATMVAAGVYLAGRFYPIFTPEVLLVIAYVGCITLFIGATIALVATDIKRVLAYSTISQLGYMMLALGVGGWIAGLFHLITHAFFKSLMFLCSGSVIHGCHHEQEMTKMGGLHKKMPVTCWTMFVGVVAIGGLAIPLLTLPGFGPIAFSGYHSKDAIVATAMAYSQLNPVHSLLFFIPLITAGITAFYMFRMWFMTFFGAPRDHHVYDHAHESPRVMTWPLLVLSFFAIFVAVGGEPGPLVSLFATAEPAHLAGGDETTAVRLPGHGLIHELHATAGAVALLMAFGGTFLAYLFYGAQRIDPDTIRSQLQPVHTFLVEKWQFDNLYDWMWVRPVHVIARWCTLFDKYVLDGTIHFLSWLTVMIAGWERVSVRKFDEAVVDRVVNVFGEATYSVGRSLRTLQTGRIRQYVMFIAMSVVGLFMLMFGFMPR